MLFFYLRKRYVDNNALEFVSVSIAILRWNGSLWEIEKAVYSVINGLSQRSRERYNIDRLLTV